MRHGQESTCQHRRRSVMQPQATSEAGWAHAPPPPPARCRAGHAPPATRCGCRAAGSAEGRQGGRGNQGETAGGQPHAAAGLLCASSQAQPPPFTPNNPPCQLCCWPPCAPDPVTPHTRTWNRSADSGVRRAMISGWSCAFTPCAISSFSSAQAGPGEHRPGLQSAPRCLRDKPSIDHTRCAIPHPIRPSCLPIRTPTNHPPSPSPWPTRDQLRHVVHELHQPLRDEHHPKVLAQLRALSHHVRHLRRASVGQQQARTLGHPALCTAPPRQPPEARLVGYRGVGGS